MQQKVDAELESDLRCEMPGRFCASGWRRIVVGVGLLSLLVLAYSLERYFAAEASGVEGAPPPIVVSSASFDVAAPAPGSPTMPVAGEVPLAAGGMGAPLGGEVRLVGGGGGTPFNAAAEAIRPSVVGIRAFDGDRPGPRVQRVGSGLLVDPRGYVVTCRHVIGSASTILVRRFRRRDEALPARLIAAENDLALLQILQGGPFESATFADSTGVRVGDWVLAIGHPFSLGLTVTAGIVGRTNSTLSIPGGGQYADVIQTDAPINEGSSGGPLVALDGRVVGLNTAIYAPTGVFSGAGFAIPSNRIRDFVSRHLPAGAFRGDRGEPDVSERRRTYAATGRVAAERGGEA